MSWSVALSMLQARSWEAVPLPEPVAVTELPTPALLLDEAAFERNLAAMATFLQARGKGFRPHAKTHKCPLIAHRQLAAGAVGICAAKVSEALVLGKAGVTPILITSPVTTPGKARLIADLCGQSPGLAVVVDGVPGFEVLAESLPPEASLGVVIDIDVAMGRTGTRDLDLALELAERITRQPNMTLHGVQHYAGHLMHVEGHAERRSRSLALWELAAETVAALSRRGFGPSVVTGAGTGTYDIDCEVEVITDLQVGSYVFMDREYRLIGGRNGATFDDFEVSLTVAATAISQPVDGAVTVDAGYKAFASDTVDPEPLSVPGARFRFAGDEHGVLLLGKGANEPALGSVHQFVTPHCDPTVNLYDYFWVHRDGLAHSLWPIAARGCSW